MHDFQIEAIQILGEVHSSAMVMLDSKKRGRRRGYDGYGTCTFEEDTRECGFQRPDGTRANVMGTKWYKTHLRPGVGETYPVESHSVMRSGAKVVTAWRFYIAPILPGTGDKRECNIHVESPQMGRLRSKGWEGYAR